MRQIILIVAVLAQTLLLTSCVPEFKNPLPPPEEMKPDTTLLGTWVSISEEEWKSKIQVSIFGRKSGWMDLIFIGDTDGSNSDDGVNVSIYEAYSAKVGKDSFLCLRDRKKDRSEQDENRESLYLIAHYLVSPEGELSLSLFDEDALKTMVENGVLKGVVNEGTYIDSVTVEASSDELASAIADKGVEAFISRSYTLMFKRYGHDERPSTLQMK